MEYSCIHGYVVSYIMLWWCKAPRQSNENEYNVCSWLSAQPCSMVSEYSYHTYCPNGCPQDQNFVQQQEIENGGTKPIVQIPNAFFVGYLRYPELLSRY